MSELRFTIRRTPRARATVTTAGSASGMAATASAIPQMNISRGSKPLSTPRMETPVTTIIVIIPIHRPSWSRLFCSGVLSRTICPSMPARCPNSVCMPVAVTTAFPLPYEIDVPI